MRFKPSPSLFKVILVSGRERTKNPLGVILVPAGNVRVVILPTVSDICQSERSTSKLF